MNEFDEEIYKQNDIVILFGNSLNEINAAVNIYEIELSNMLDFWGRSKTVFEVTMMQYLRQHIFRFMAETPYLGRTQVILEKQKKV